MKDWTPEGLINEEGNIGKAMSFLMDLGIVTDYASDYGERGYSLDNDEGFFAIGNWWCRLGQYGRGECDFEECYTNGTKKTHSIDLHYPSLFTWLEGLGMETAFDDEWIIIDDKAYRTEPDSYSWESSLLYTDGEYLTPDDDFDSWLEVVANSSSHALPSFLWDKELAAAGFVERECDFESGWYGREDDPAKIMEAIKEEEPHSDVVFKLSGVGQFAARFCVYVREGSNNDEDGTDDE